MDGAKILLVDDESSILRALTRALEELGLTILTAPGGQAGLELMETHEVAAIVSDQRMPGMSGDEFLRRARKMQPCAVRIVLTGYADMDAAASLINTGGIHRYIAKPWDDGELRMTVRNAVTLYEMTLENRRLGEQARLHNEQLRQLNARLAQQVSEQTARLETQNEALQAVNQRQRETQWSVLEAFASLLEMIHPTLHGHARRVAARAEALGRHVGLDEEDIDAIRMAALLHDIGKVGLDVALLDKPAARLTPAEREALRRHPERGQTILMAIEDFRAVGVLIRHHHERHDGRGYPDGLAGEAIPIGSRIIAIANGFDHAMEYEGQGAQPSQRRAYAALLEESAKEFDPRLVTQFGEMTALADDSAPEPSLAERTLTFDQLTLALVLAADVKTRDGLVVAARGLMIDNRVLGSIRRMKLCGRIEDRFQVYQDAPPAAQPIIGGRR